MAADSHRFGIQDIIAVAVLVGAATFLLQGKLETLALRLSPSLRQVLAQWWPLLLIVVGIILLFTHYRSGKRSRAARIVSSLPRGTHEFRA